LARLLSAVESLAAGPQGTHYGGVVDALRQLANAIELLPNAGQYSIGVIRETAERLESADPLSVAHADLVKKGLGAALQVLVTRSGSDGHEFDYQRAVRAFGVAVEAIDKERPMREQYANVAGAFRAATDTVFLVAGGEAPFGEAETRNSDATQSISIESAVEEARAEVLKLGQMDWTQARQASSRALSALADVVAAADRRNTLDRKVSDIRLQAERVRYADSLSFGRAAWIKTGLSAALDALEGGLIGDQRLAVWTRAARRAVASIEERDSLGFQRAAVQDAFRATVDAFVAATQPAPACR